MMQEIEITLKLSLTVDAEQPTHDLLALAHDYATAVAELVPERCEVETHGCTVEKLREEGEIYSEQPPSREEYQLGNPRTMGDVRAILFKLNRRDLHDAINWATQAIPGDASLDAAHDLTARAVKEFGVKYS